MSLRGVIEKDNNIVKNRTEQDKPRVSKKDFLKKGRSNKLKSKPKLKLLNREPFFKKEKIMQTKLGRNSKGKNIWIVHDQSNKPKKKQIKCNKFSKMLKI